MGPEPSPPADSPSSVTRVRTVESEITRYTLRDDGIVVAVGLHPEIPRTLEKMTESLDAFAALIDGKPRPFLWDPRAVPRLLTEAWKEAIERINRLAVAVAIMTDENTDEMLGGYPDAVDFLLPVRTFTDEDDALAWLRGFVD